MASSTLTTLVSSSAAGASAGSLKDVVVRQGDTPVLDLAFEGDSRFGIIGTGGISAAQLVFTAVGATTPKVSVALPLTALSMVADAAANRQVLHVSYQLTATDTNTPGDYLGEVHLTFSYGDHLAVPADRCLTMTVLPSLSET